MYEFELDSVCSVNRVFSILKILGEVGECSVSELFLRTNIPMKTVIRFLLTMKKLGYVKQERKTDRYSLTLRLFELGANMLEYNDLSELAVVHMMALRNSINETVNLGVLVDNGKVHYLRSMVAEHEICSASIIKNSVPVYSSALGKIMTAWLREVDVRQLLSGVDFIPHTNNTIRDTESYICSLEKVREHGYAEENEESEPGLCCIAAPIYNEIGRVIAGLSLSMPSERMHKHSRERLLIQLHNSARIISELMGYDFYSH